MYARFFLTLLLVVISAIPAAAQGGIGFGPQLGIYKVHDQEGARLMGGASLRIKLSEALGVEGSINYRHDEYSDGMVEATSWPVMVTGLIYPLPIIYGAIGAGWYNTSIEYNLPPGFLGGPGVITDETKQEFGWHFGGGAELPVGETVKLVGDVRYVFLDYEFESFPGTEANSNFFVITAGLLFGL